MDEESKVVDFGAGKAPELSGMDLELAEEVRRDLQELAKKVVRLFGPFAQGPLGTPMYQADIRLKEAFHWINEGVGLYNHLNSAAVDALAESGPGVKDV